jgi:transcriptional regulator with XRE-family HTH domain
MIKESSNQESAGLKIGHYTNYQRLKRGLSLNEFSRIIGVNPSFLMRLEKGVYQSVSIHIIEKIANGFEMSLDDLLHKCQVTPSAKDKLPDIEYYLKEKYQLPAAAIDDAKLFISFLKKKYKSQINEMKKAHEDYWKSS